VDNSKIELLFAGASMADFWKQANGAIVEPLHLFNQLSALPSEHGSLDSMDFVRILTTGDCSLYGVTEVSQYEDESAIAEAMINSVKSGLLADNFDLTQARSAGVIITGTKAVLQKVSASALEYGFSMVSKICNDSLIIFRGVYETPGDDDVLHIYTFFSGLGLPEARVSELKREADKHSEVLKNKENNRAQSMNIDMGKTNTTSAADAMHKKIVAKNSPMGKLVQNARNVVDKRRR
jgi:hypothetical protein